MADIETGVTELCSHADAEVSRLLLLSLTEAMMERKLLRREDIAGALLRTEFRAKALDDCRQVEGAIIAPLEERARLTTDEWGAAFALAPEVYTLRKQEGEYQKAGAQTRHPWYADQVISLYSTADEVD